MIIRGNKKKISEIWKKHFPLDEKNGTHYFDFNTLIPYPQRFIYQDELSRKHREANPDDWSVKDGFNSGGFEWCVEAWGTKWNAYDQEVNYYGGVIKAEFYTAWRPPKGILQKLCELYPDVQITSSYEEAGMGFEGVYDNQNGKVVNLLHIECSKRLLRGG